MLKSVDEFILEYIQLWSKNNRCLILDFSSSDVSWVEISYVGCDESFNIRLLMTDGYFTTVCIRTHTSCFKPRVFLRLNNHSCGRGYCLPKCSHSVCNGGHAVSSFMFRGCNVSMVYI